MTVQGVARVLWRTVPSTVREGLSAQAGEQRDLRSLEMPVVAAAETLGPAAAAAAIAVAFVAADFVAAVAVVAVAAAAQGRFRRLRRYQPKNPGGPS